MQSLLSIIVTYNRKLLLQKCLESLKHQSFSTFDILVIDNGSTDGSREYLQELEISGSCKTIFTDRNLGGAGGFSMGIRYAVVHGYSHIWLMDDDTVPEPDALQKLLEADSQVETYGFLVSLPVWTDNSICKMNKPLLGSLFDQNADILRSGYLPVKNATFVSMLLRTETISNVGLPIKEFFIWGDDWEYTERISQKYKNYLVLSSCVKHLMKSNVGSDLSTDDPSRINRYYYSYRNEFYISKNKGFLSTLYYFFRVLSMLFKILIWPSSQKINRIKCLSCGVKDGFLFNPPIEYVEKGVNV